MVAAGIAEVQEYKPFKVLMDNFGTFPVKLKENQKVALEEPHPSAVIESEITHAELLGLTLEGTRIGVKTTDTLYRKRDTNARDLSVIN